MYESDAEDVRAMLEQGSRGWMDVCSEDETHKKGSPTKLISVPEIIGSTLGISTFDDYIIGNRSPLSNAPSSPGEFKYLTGKLEDEFCQNEDDLNEDSLLETLLERASTPTTLPTSSEQPSIPESSIILPHHSLPLSLKIVLCSSASRKNSALLDILRRKPRNFLVADPILPSQQASVLGHVAKCIKYLRYGSGWNPREDKALREAVIQVNSELFHSALSNRIHNDTRPIVLELLRILYGDSFNPSEIFTLIDYERGMSLLTMLNNIEIKSPEERKVLGVPPTVLSTNYYAVDWGRIYSFMKDTLPLISSEACRLRWLVQLHPAINNGPFSASELVQLKNVVSNLRESNAEKQNGEFFWQAVSRELGSNRTPIRCFQEYQRKLNTTLLKKGWSQEEDHILRAAVANPICRAAVNRRKRRWGFIPKSGHNIEENEVPNEEIQIHEDIHWATVATFLEGHSPEQCLHRWQKVLHPGIKKGRWDPGEDELLSAAVSNPICMTQTKTGKTKINWAKVRELVPGRTDMQCRERWMNILDPAVSRDEFTEEEDQRLLKLIEENVGAGWSVLAAKFGGNRTDNQLSRRWKALTARSSKKVKSETKGEAVEKKPSKRGRKPKNGEKECIN